jgi:hypothetical protein
MLAQAFGNESKSQTQIHDCKNGLKMAKLQMKLTHALDDLQGQKITNTSKMFVKSSTQTNI